MCNLDYAPANGGGLRFGSRRSQPHWRANPRGHGVAEMHVQDGGLSARELAREMLYVRQRALALHRKGYLSWCERLRGQRPGADEVPVGAKMRNFPHNRAFSRKNR